MPMSSPLQRVASRSSRRERRHGVLTERGDLAKSHAQAQVDARDWIAARVERVREHAVDKRAASAALVRRGKAAREHVKRSKNDDEIQEEQTNPLGLCRGYVGAPAWVQKTQLPAESVKFCADK